MHISYEVSGFYDWEPAEKHGVTVTEDDVLKMRAKPVMNGGFHIRVEKKLDTQHGHNLPERAICQHIAQQAAAGKEMTREEAVCDLARDSNKHHIARRHVKAIAVHDDGPDEELMKACLDAAGVTGAAREEALRGYLEDVDLAESLAAQFGPRTRK